MLAIKIIRLTINAASFSLMNSDTSKTISNAARYTKIKVTERTRLKSTKTLLVNFILIKA